MAKRRVNSLTHSLSFFFLSLTRVKRWDMAAVWLERERGRWMHVKRKVRCLSSPKGYLRMISSLSVMYMWLTTSTLILSYVPLPIASTTTTFKGRDRERMREIEGVGLWERNPTEIFPLCQTLFFLIWRFLRVIASIHPSYPLSLSFSFYSQFHQNLLFISSSSFSSFNWTLLS